MNFRIKLTLAALAAFILMNSAVSFAAPSMDTRSIKLTTGSDIPWPPPGNPADPTDPNNNDDGSGSDSSSGSDCGHDHDSDSGSDNSNPDNPYDPNNEPMPN